MTTNDTAPAPKAPAYIAHHVRDGKGDKGFWTRIGAGWMSKDGKGINLQLDVIPLDGKVILRPNTENK